MKSYPSLTLIHSHAFTLASVGFEVFRTHMLPRHTLAITPHNGYTPRLHSAKAMAWLDMCQKDEIMTIRREFKFGPYYADGFIIEEAKAFEFWGCYYHGCPICRPDEELYKRTLEKRNGEEFV